MKYLDTLKIEVPIIFSGGCGKLNHIINIKKHLGQEDAIAIASVLHYDLLKITDIKKDLKYSLCNLIT